MEKIMRASKIGFPCDRNIWYSANGNEEVISGRTQRIFDVGTCLEPLIISWIKNDGWNVDYNQGSQEAALTVEIPVKGGIISGHPDAFIWHDGNEKNPILIDVKTMNDRAYTLWKREGTIKKYPQYVDQLHIYAAAFNIWRKQDIEISTLGVVGMNKNTSDYCYDFFDYDLKRAKEIIHRAGKIFECDDAPEPGERLQSWSCNYCGFKGLCDFNRNEQDNAGRSE